ncbi:MAG: serine hydrolase domain-containing protein [Pseudomonadota bacterium]
MDTATAVDPAEMGMNRSRLDAIPQFFDDRYISKGKLPCMATLVARGGEIVHEAYRGTTHLAGDGVPIGPESIFRIYSMTKPVTSLAGMMLIEAGDLRLDHNVSRYIPEFAGIRVWAGGDLDTYETQAPEREINIRDLFLHTSGLTYAFLHQHEVDGLYRRENLGTFANSSEISLKTLCERLAALTLLFSQVARWNYGHSTDVIGRVIVVVSGQALDVFLQDQIFAPLGMTSTGFHVPEAQIDRLTTCYAKDPLSGETSLFDGAGGATGLFKDPPVWINAGGGLVSTPRDFLAFCQCLLNGGRLGSSRLISPKTWEFMGLNHLPGGATLRDMGDRTFSESRMEGAGFGLGGSVIVDVAASGQAGSLGTFSWGGLANTFFWIDPVEDLIAIQMTQMMPSGCYPIRPQFNALVYAAIDG